MSSDVSQTTARCPDCGAIGMDNCERVTCRWDQWDDGTPVTAKQRAEGAAFADAINRQIAERDQKEVAYRTEIARWMKEQST